MPTQNNDPATVRRPLRLWPGVVAALLLLAAKFAVPLIPDAGVFGLIGGIAGAFLIFVWWLFFSRAAWVERLGAFLVMAIGLFATYRVVDPSIAGGAQGMLVPVLAIPVLALALVAWAVATNRLSNGIRRASMVVAILLACATLTLIRTGGLSAGGALDLHWRWTPTPEERLLAEVKDDPIAAPPPAAPTPSAPIAPEANREVSRGSIPAAKPSPAEPVAPHTAEQHAAIPSVASAPEKIAEWPGFRGPRRDSVVRDVRIDTDWSRTPPMQIWRRPIGPSWSSFAVSGDLLYTQEQRGEDEIVACYKVSTGEPVWRHRDHARFYESNGGAGPRGTPTLANGRVYAFGATGILKALDAATGALVWSHNAATDTRRRTPDWGFASSPLVLDNLVIIAVSGTLAAYDEKTGDKRWVGPQHGGSYSSPQLVTLDGVAQVVVLSGDGATSVDPGTGATLWQHEWGPASSIVQPAVTDDGDLLINSITATGGLGVRRLHVSQDAGKWRVEERWTSNGLKPYFNDFVIHKGHAYGFDGSILACIDLNDGKRKWKGGRYGNGQVLLLADQDVLLVLSEEGELALVSATTDQFKELARFPALDGKTWNHPVLVRDVLLVRNGEEMAAFRLSLGGSVPTQ